MFFEGALGPLRQAFLLAKLIKPSRGASLFNELIRRKKFRKGMYATFKRYVKRDSSQTDVKVDDCVEYKHFHVCIDFLECCHFRLAGGTSVETLKHVLDLSYLDYLSNVCTPSSRVTCKGILCKLTAK